MAARLIDTYADTPMDADATRVVLADDVGVMDTLTLDRRRFSLSHAERKRLPSDRVLT